MTTTLRPPMQIDRLLTVDQGTKLMVAAKDVVEDVLTVVADEANESLWVQVRIDERIVEIPIDVIEQLLARSRDEVHSESWFERHAEEQR